MTCNTISLVSRLIWKRFRWKFIDIFEDVCSLHTCFSADSLHLLCCITPCESSRRFFRATRYIPGNFFVIFDAKSHVWGQFGPENKLIEGQPNEYDHGAKRRFYTVVRRDLPERVSVSVPPVANDSCRSAVPAPKYLPERRSIAFPHYYTPVHDVSRMSHISL